MGAFSNIKGLQFYQNPSDDPYVTLDEVNDDEDSHEREELEIYPNDNLIIAARTKMMYQTRYICIRSRRREFICPS
ncbi:hypothetical protein H4Q26_007390 [Puccinia striiformis f. sp. tritici PST-130]|nr:hypothetical protein H4Q26_007390 [Puccinia striiformis f. sp. tritici PST-130]